MELIAKDLDDEPFPPDNETLVLKIEIQYFTQVPGTFRGIAGKIFHIMAKNIRDLQH